MCHFGRLRRRRGSEKRSAEQHSAATFYKGLPRIRCAR